MEFKKIINWGIPLPARIAPVIFSKLSISNLPACRLVSKSWNSLVLDYATTSSRKAILYSSNDYNRTYHSCFRNPKIYCFEIDTWSFVASCTIIGPLTEFNTIFACCNGLLLCENGGVDIGSQSIGIFNPMTHEFFPIPYHVEFYLGFYHGFGFSLKTNRYKLFLVSDEGCEMMILRFGKDHNQFISVFLPSPLTLTSHGCYMDGVIYWIGRKIQNEYIIYALDVETEKFEVVAVLKGCTYSKRAFLQPFNGTIYAIICMTEASYIQMWRMQAKYSWIKDFSVHGDIVYKSFELLKVYDDGKICVRINCDLFWLNKSKLNKSVWTIETKNKIKTLIPHDERRFHNMCTCLVESLHFGSLSSILAGDEQKSNALLFEL